MIGHVSERAGPPDEIERYSRATIEAGSKSFAAASRLLDSKSRESAHLLYAWCRYCDDQIDSQHLGSSPNVEYQASHAMLEALETDTRRALAGERVSHPAFVALQRVVRRHGIPDRYPLELLQGFRMDVEQYRYDRLEDTLLYCYHVAGVVGVMMAYVMGTKDGDALLRAADLGIAFQLTNIARDVMDDARVGRIYLPSEWMKEAGVPPEGILQSAHRPAVFVVVRRLLCEAENYYDSAVQGLPHLGWSAAWGIATARNIYRDIGRVIVKRGTAAWDERVVVGRARKLYGAVLGLQSSLIAHSVGKLIPARGRSGLWTKPA